MRIHFNLLSQEWEDDFLSWDPADYGGIEHLVLPPHTLWLPDFGIRNRQEKQNKIREDEKCIIIE